MPDWVQLGYNEYVKRLPKNCQLHLVEINSFKRTKTSVIEAIKSEESAALFNAAPKNSLIITLDEHGKEWSTRELAQNLQNWQLTEQNISLLIGGPDGLASEYLQKARLNWSLSKLTLPHHLVRVMVAEQLYRAWSILQHHPYHRE
jgi:23S rRNA (pseudouridine1915-N3)-methyltransferase